MLRKFIFRYNNRGYDNELILPVTPELFEIENGVKIETINIHEMGDVVLAGYGTLATIRLDCLFPAQKYPFVVGPFNPNPYVFTSAFATWAKNKMVARFVVSDTDINIPVLVESIQYGEKDGTNDVYATITLREYRELSVVQVQTAAASGNNPRPAETPPAAPQTYTIKSGDTLSAICRSLYGDASLYPKLAKVNGIKNPNLIYAGTILKTPAKEALG